MTKGYLIFVEGGDAPTVVHETFPAALHETLRLSRINKGREVQLLQIHKRFLTAEKEPVKLGTHLPPNSGKKRLSTRDLVMREDAA